MKRRKRVNRVAWVWTFNGGGDDHEGLFRARKMLNEERIEALEQLLIRHFNSAFLTSQLFMANAFNLALFCLVIRPRADTSTEYCKTVKF